MNHPPTQVSKPGWASEALRHPPLSEDPMALTYEGKIVNDFINQNEALLVNLWARWQDEKFYEDIRKYGALLHSFMPAKMTVVRSNKRPFGVDVKVEKKVYRISVTARHIGWKQRV